MEKEFRPTWVQRITVSSCLMVGVRREPSRKLISANRNLTLNAVAGAAFGAAGQRCMALSVGES